jgi:hypothetical protein
LLIIFFIIGIGYTGRNIRSQAMTVPLLNNLLSLKPIPAEQLSMIADTLSQEGKFDGLKVLWEKTDLQKLPALNSYLAKVDTGNFFVYADLAAVFHNSGNFALRDTCLRKAKQTKKFRKQFYSLDTLIAHNKQFDYVTYSELIYGGM